MGARRGLDQGFVGGLRDINYRMAPITEPSDF
jgi:hypothetical protein